jgi:superfamily I DNA/RNA helicase
LFAKSVYHILNIANHEVDEKYTVEMFHSFLSKMLRKNFQEMGNDVMKRGTGYYNVVRR